MSTFQHKPDTGHLFKNDRRDKDTQPNARGTALIDGVEWYVDAWTNEKNGTKYQSLKFKRKELAGAQAAPARPPRAKDEAYRAGSAADDEAPF